MDRKIEKVFMLRCWQEKEDDDQWRTSLKAIDANNQAARYFIGLNSIMPYLRSQLDMVKVQHSKVASTDT